MATDLKTLTASLFVDKKYQGMPPLEKYKVCVNLLALQPLEQVAPLLQDAPHWRHLVNVAHGLPMQSDMVDTLRDTECAAIADALQRAGHAIHRNDRYTVASVVSDWRQRHAPTSCDAYILFNALFVSDYGCSARALAREYTEARCSNLCQRQASPQHCYNGEIFFCSAECRQHYVRLLDAI